MGISAVLFGLSHLQTTLEGYLLVLLIIIPLGMFLAYLYERRGTLLVPILTHAVFNLVQVFELIRQSTA
jgi:membrane protease YdiL (CAAX protease family)